MKNPEILYMKIELTKAYHVLMRLLQSDMNQRVAETMNKIGLDLGEVYKLLNQIQGIE